MPTTFREKVVGKLFISYGRYAYASYLHLLKNWLHLN